MHRGKIAVILTFGLNFFISSTAAADNPQTSQVNKRVDSLLQTPLQTPLQNPSQIAPPAPSAPPLKLTPITLAPAAAPAQAAVLGEVDYWIDPDRPHIADSSVNVPKGLMLQENGFQQLYANSKSGIFDFPETLMRLGVTNKTELRYNTPNFFAQKANSRNTDLAVFSQRSVSFQNMQVGFKRRLGPIGKCKFQIAVNPYISIPSGFSNQSKRVDGFVKFPFSQEINEHWDIEGMQSFFYPTGTDGRRNLDWQNSLVLNRSWGRQKNVFIEYVGDVFERGPMSNLIHFGGAYRPTRRQQMDVQFGFRMNNAAPIAFFGLGYSFLLGPLNTPRLTPSRFRQ